MKNSAILQMFYGKRGSLSSIEPTDKYQELLKNAVRYEKEFLEKLKQYPELLAFFQLVDASAAAAYDESVRMYYTEGFRFGLLMGLEI